MFSGDFDAFMLKMIFKKLKKYYFNVFLSEKYFKNNRNHTFKHLLKNLMTISDFSLKM